MALLWQLQHDQWQPGLLAGSLQALAADGEPREVVSLAGTPAGLRAVGGEWVLLSGRGAPALNGAPLRCGIRVLRDRDELRFDTGARVFFSTERLAIVLPFEGATPVCCPRCRQTVTRETLVVTCPACGAVSHQTPELSCWTYSATCPLCDQPTALDTGYRWTPEEL